MHHAVMLPEDKFRELTVLVGKISRRVGRDLVSSTTEAKPILVFAKCLLGLFSSATWERVESDFNIRLLTKMLREAPSADEEVAEACDYVDKKLDQIAEIYTTAGTPASTDVQVLAEDGCRKVCDHIKRKLAQVTAIKDDVRVDAESRLEAQKMANELEERLEAFAPLLALPPAQPPQQAKTAAPSQPTSTSMATRMAALLRNELLGFRGMSCFREAINMRTAGGEAGWIDGVILGLNSPNRATWESAVKAIQEVLTKIADTGLLSCDTIDSVGKARGILSAWQVAKLVV